MQAKAKKITLYLENGTLDGLVNISETDGWDFGGELYSCPRDNVDALVNNPFINNKIGVYLLLSTDRVYVGQSIDLASRITQHKLGKDWWERVILFTSKNNELNQSHITYLESKLIQKGIECSTVDSENKTFGNKTCLGIGDAKLLDQYLDEAFFVLELLGINVFKKNKEQTKSQITLSTITEKTEEDRELRAKSETARFLKNKGIVLTKNFSYSKLQEKKNRFWINPKTSFLDEEWMLVLNNQVQKKIYVLKVPKNSFKCSLDIVGTLIVRKDKPYYIDLNIDTDTFVDYRSKLSFKKFIIKEIDY